MAGAVSCAMHDRPRRLPIGAELTPDGAGVAFRVWAPAAKQLAVVIEAPAARDVALTAEPGGYFSGLVLGLAPGARYRLRMDARTDLLSDPASRFQPEGPFGPSEVIDPAAFVWTDAAWRGIPRDGHVLYELHVGTFTPAGTWAAAMEVLPYLADVGITTLEVMPVNDFDGPRGWGYDGVNFYAPTRLYGRPDELRAFVNRAHALGLAVILDVVYNHLGPAGNMMFELAPAYRFAGKQNDWGETLDFSVSGTREFFVANAGYWIDEFHLDGLRIDATQAIHDAPRDDASQHVIQEMVDRARAAAPERTLFIVGENEPQHANLITEHGLDALWNDDFHHTARVALTGLIDGYLHDYHGTSQELISAVTRGFLYQGQLYPWQKQPRGSPTRGLAPARFVHFLENHDQVANLGNGARLTTISDPMTLRALTALLLLTPPLPMLFQGQEMGSRAPWFYFASHGPELDALVHAGRNAFCKQFDTLGTREGQDALTVPGAEATFRACILDPALRDLDAPAVRLHRDLLALRKRDRAYTDQRPGACDGALLRDRAFCFRYWQDDPADDRLLLVNLGNTLHAGSVAEPRIAPPTGCAWTLIWSSDDPRYGGHGTPPPFTPAGMMIPGRGAVLLAPTRLLATTTKPKD